MTVLKKNRKSHLTKKMFLDEAVDIQRFDELKYPAIDKVTEKQLGFFWRPEEVDISKDKKDFNGLTEHEKHIFTSNLKRQILLDSVQGRAPNLAFLPICSLPEVENWIETWSFFETIHSRSYTHIIRNIYPDPSFVFDGMLDVKEILECGKDIAQYYDTLIEANENKDISKMDHKRAIWMCLMSANALEGIRFYVSFACSWAFAELKKMEGNAKIIKFMFHPEMKEGVEKRQLQLKDYITSLTEYMIDKGMEITPLPEVKIRRDEDNAGNFFGRTAHYDPNSKEIVLYVTGRHDKDIVRSYSHEMIHHMQNLNGTLGNVNTSNTNEDDHLMELEKQAYLEGNITFRNWEDSLK